MKCLTWILLLFVAVAWPFQTDEVSPKSTLRLARTAAMEILRNITNRWEVDTYPVFLKVCWMQDAAYGRMRDRLQLRALSALLGKSESFVIAFTGSSVTAGHDSPFRASYPVLVESAMEPAFRSLGISLTVRNAAMGNNPCMPYDACVGTFAGEDADVISWEQSYNCNPGNKGYLFEQFVRQVFEKLGIRVAFSF